MKKNIPLFISLTNVLISFVIILLIIVNFNELFIRVNGDDIKVHDYVILICRLIIVGALLDGLDGFLARKFKSSSEFGKSIDSLCDVIIFGLVPSILIWVICYNISQSDSIIFYFSYICSFFYLIAVVIRLARFNTKGNTKGLFYGLPSPAGTIAIIVLILVYSDFPVFNIHEILPFYSFLIAVLMLNNSLRFNHVGVFLFGRYNFGKFIAVSLYLGLLFVYPAIICLISIVAYIIRGLMISKA